MFKVLVGFVMAKHVRVLVTGSRGFIGRSFVASLQSMQFYVTSVIRSSGGANNILPNEVCIDSLDSSTNWSSVLKDIDVVVHLAARSYIVNDHALDPLEEYRQANTYSTLNLATEAARVGVRRFVFVSTLKVNGELSQVGKPFRFDDKPQPQSPYAISKYEAERGLHKIAAETGMEVVVVRPPLVYGAGVKGNFASLLRWVEKGLPLPLGGVTNNKRSLVGLDNLVDVLLACVSHPSAANQTFLVSDGEDLSTVELLQRIGHAIGRVPLLLRVPPQSLNFVATLLGKSGVATRLLGCLQVDIAHTCEILGWRPRITVDEGLRRTVNHVSEKVHL